MSNQLVQIISCNDFYLYGVIELLYKICFNTNHEKKSAMPLSICHKIYNLQSGRWAIYRDCVSFAEYHMYMMVYSKCFRRHICGMIYCIYDR